MTTSEIETLYIGAMDDFLRLLNDAPCLAKIDGTLLAFFKHPGPGWSLLADGERIDIPAALAVAAMTESWRQRLEEKHKVFIHHRQYFKSAVPEGDAWVEGGWHVSQNGLPPRHLVDGEFANTTLGENGFRSLPEAICAAVKALADEKRATDSQAAECIKSVSAIFGTGQSKALQSPQIQWDARIRQIVREEHSQWLAAVMSEVAKDLPQERFYSPVRIVVREELTRILRGRTVSPNKEPQSD